MVEENGRILWPALCGNRSDWDLFWDTNYTWTTETPDLTRCFQDTVLVWVPCGYLMVAALLYVPYLLYSPRFNISRYITRLCAAKLVVCSMLVMVVIMNLIMACKAARTPLAEILAPVILSMSYMLAAVIVWLESTRVVPSSGVLIIFWLLQLVLGIIPFRSHIVHPHAQEHWSRSVCFYLEYSFSVILFILHCFNDKPTSGNKHDEKTYLLLSNSIDDTELQVKPCPEQKANLISRILFFWMSRLIINGYKRPLIFNDLWELAPQDSCSTIVPRFQSYWEKQVKDMGWQMVKKKNNSASNATSEDRKKQRLPSIWRPLIAVFGGHYMLGGFFKLCYDIITFISPQLLSLLITFVATCDPYQWHGLVYVLLLFVVSGLKTVFIQQYQHASFRVGMQVRTAVSTIIYRKALVLNSTAKRSCTVGEIVNLMSVDAQKLQDACQYMHILWSAPFTIVLGLYFVWEQLGNATWASLCIMIMLIPINAWISEKTRSLQILQMKQKDSRIKLMNEVLSGIKVLKLYAWETSFQERLNKIREQELQTLNSMALLGAGTAIAFFIAPYLLSLGAFATFVLLSPDNVLDANKAFVSLALFNLMNLPIAQLPAAIAYGIQALVSIGRINKFMQNEELDPANVVQDTRVGDRIKISGANFSWGDNMATLKHINLSIPEGKLVAIVGMVGSGKSSLLSAMLGEMEVIAGRVHLKGSVAYVPQQAWIQNATVKGNILFGCGYDPTKYQTVIDTCALMPDLQILPGGDMTEIGEKGVNLSGGQKQRLSLARAVYQNNDIYLLDDPLSAVDGHVGKHIFDKVIGPNGTLRGKTRVLVTNGLTFLPQVDMIVVLKDGCISETGSYQELLRNKGAFAEFLTQYLTEQAEEEDDHELRELHESLLDSLSELTSSTSEAEGLRSPKLGKRLGKRKRSKSEDATSARRSNQKLIVEEAAETGSVKRNVFMAYLKNYQFLNAALTLGAYLTFLTAKAFTYIWLAKWSGDAPTISGTQDIGQRDLRLGVYGGVGGVQIMGILWQSFVLAFGTVQASRMLHFNLLKAILRAPMSFFDTTPLGRLLNRFGKEVDTIDFNVPLTMKIWMDNFGNVMTTIFVISYSTPLFLIVLIPLTISYFFVQRFYQATSRQLKRLESVRKSPIYAHFSETIAGTSTIRAYQVTDRFVEQSDQLTDENNMAYFPFVASNWWLGINLETIGNFIVLFAGVFAVTGSVDAGTAGLSVGFALQVTGQLNMVVRMTCEFENHIVAVERLQEYTECPQEAPAVIQDKRPDKQWPQHGRVTFQQYSTWYRMGLDLVLKGISCTFLPGEKVGIVGRTGAGKSSLTLALFRIIEAVSGSILIDGENISNMGLDDLRSKLTIIPQDPVLFSGTLRMNLDPFETKSDEDLWRCLELAHLKTFVQSLPEKLDHPCSEGGENLSVGQRQLVCLARALLRKTRILVLDESTAAVDMETDNLIQATIRAEFKDCTVITIAHRLLTIMDCDRIVVLDSGCISEFDSPAELLRNKNGIYYGMVKDAGLL